MSNKSKTMLQIRRMLQLMQNGSSKREISKQLGMSRNTLDQYEIKFHNNGHTFEQLLLMPNEELSLIVYNQSLSKQKDPRYEYLQEQFRYYKKQLEGIGVTKYLLWQEYRISQPTGYSYSQFCEHLAKYFLISHAVMHLDHKPGETLQVDFAGDKISYVDKETGLIVECPVLVCVLPYSSYMYVEALSCQGQEELVLSLNHCLHYFGGVPQNIKSDNMKQWVIKANRYEPALNELIESFSLHYNTSIAASRVRKPRDKASVEKAVDLTYKRIFAPLRNMVFFSLKELNIAIKEQLDKHNKTIMQKRSYSRYERFIQEERSCLRPLPAEYFVLKHTAKAKVQRNYHIILGEDWHQYSVPYQHIGKTVNLVYDLEHVEIYLNLQRIAIHQRNKSRNGYSTLAEHMPEHHRYYQKSMGWNEEYFLTEAGKIGENTTMVFNQILQSRQFTEQTYNSCLGILRLAKHYSDPRMEAACARALLCGKVSYSRLKNILMNNKDKEPAFVPVQLIIPLHDNIRGPQAFNKSITN